MGVPMFLLTFFSLVQVRILAEVLDPEAVNLITEVAWSFGLDIDDVAQKA
jgi:hypothetical protein